VQLLKLFTGWLTASIIYNISGLEGRILIMPQLSIYLDADTIKKIEKAAEIENTSISKWVSARLTGHLENNWPENYSSLYGSIKDNSFCAESIKDFSADVKREDL
jgi:hypothetical protein